MMATLIELAAPFAASYVVGKVGGKLGGSLVGKVLLSIAGEWFKRSAAETALEKLAKSRELTDAELSKLTQDEIDAINHSRGG